MAGGLRSSSVTPVRGAVPGFPAFAGMTEFAYSAEWMTSRTVG